MQTQVSNANSQNAFSTFVMLSLAFHFGIVAMFTFKAVFFPSTPIEIIPSIKVDLVGLPDKIEPKIEEVRPRAPAEPAAPAIPDRSKQQKSALERIKAMDAIDKLKKEMDKQQEAAKEAPRKGNVVTDGDSTTGLTKVQYDRYIRDITLHVRKFWDLPQWLSNSDLKVQIIVMLDERGFVVKKEVHKSSGNPNFDKVALETIDKAMPFPPPPASLAGELNVRGVVFAFPE